MDHEAEYTDEFVSFLELISATASSTWCSARTP
jgi:hypothetical protein